MTKDFHKKNLKNPFYKKREVKRYFSTIAFSLAFIVLIASSIYIVYYSPLFLVQNIESENLEVSKYISEKYQQVNIIKISKQELSRELTDKFQFNEVKVIKSFPKTLKIDIIERQPYFLLKINDHLEFRDKEACKIPRQDLQNIDDFPVIVKENVDLQNLKNCLKIPVHLLEQIQYLFSLTKEKNIELAYFQINPNNNNNLDLVLKSQAIVYFSLREDIDRQFFKLEQIYLEKETDLDSINYIDVRYGDRAFINYK